MFNKKLPHNKFPARMRETGFLILLALVVMLTVTACTGIILRTGNVITETRQVSYFDRIDLRGMGVVIVTQDGSESLSIETGDKVMELVEAEVVGETLVLGLEEGVNLLSNARLKFYVSVDDLSGLSVAGSGKIESELIETEDLEVRVGGSGGIDLAGEATAQDVTISGSGKYLAGDMCSEVVKVSISGSGKATVCATETLDANINGSGSVNYYGQPSISTSGSGSGKINNLGEK